jgi:hypothetical protein
MHVGIHTRIGLQCGGAGINDEHVDDDGDDEVDVEASLSQAFFSSSLDYDCGDLDGEATRRQGSAVQRVDEIDF